MAKNYKTALFGSTGYTGQTLLGLLLSHPQFSVELISSEANAGQKIYEVFPEYVSKLDLEFSSLENFDADGFDIAFFATPNGIAHKHAAKLLENGTKIVDLSADYRFRDLSIYEQWYEFKREDKELNDQAVYGLVEYKREAIKKASLIGNPGCYTTAAILALGPILESKSDLIKAGSIIVDGKSGISGAGRKAATELLYSEMNESAKPYKLANSHRHGPELEVFFSELSSKNVELSFSPHIVPMTQGLLVTCYVDFTEAVDLRPIYEEKYSKEQFVTLLDEGVYPETRWAVNTNQAFVQVAFDDRLNRATLTCAIDNLMKGAAGQALQNANLVLGMDEGLGL